MVFKSFDRSRRRGRLLAPGLAAAVLLCVCAASAPAQERSLAIPWIGLWKTNRGPLILVLSKNGIVGVLGGRIAVSGFPRPKGVLIGFWSRALKTGTKGAFLFRLARGGKAFDGRYAKTVVRELPLVWRGVKLPRDGPAGRAGRRARMPWSGAWLTMLGGIRLKQRGKRVTGTIGRYGRVTGTIRKDGKLRGTWYRTTERGERAANYFEWRLRMGGAAMSGWFTGDLSFKDIHLFYGGRLKDPDLFSRWPLPL